MLNPIELGWAGLKNYVRDKNVNFSLNDVGHLAYQWMTSLSRETAIGYINQTPRKIEDVFKKSDRFTEEIEEQVVDEEEEVSLEVEEMIDS
jgi:gamma-glutamylcysteine synthetase